MVFCGQSEVLSWLLCRDWVSARLKPISFLRVTTNMTQEGGEDTIVKSSLEATEGGDLNVTSKPTGNTARVELFFTSVTVSLPLKKEQQSLKFLLESKKVHFEEIDIAKNKEKGDEMRDRSGQRKLPQLFIN